MMVRNNRFVVIHCERDPLRLHVYEARNRIAMFACEAELLTQAVVEEARRCVLDDSTTQPPEAA